MYVWWGRSKKKGRGVHGWWGKKRKEKRIMKEKRSGTWVVGKKGKKKEKKKKEREDIQRKQREREEENEKGRYFGSCEKKILEEIIKNE
jgi:hypothetical protein